MKLEDIENDIGWHELTRNEMLKAMNSINGDLQFTMEICKDFLGEKLLTLSFSIWPEFNGLKHTYFEKSMRNQVLLVERTAMSRQALYNVLSNELRRRMEVLDEEISEKDMLEVVERFVQQLVNSEFNVKQIREIVLSGVNRKKLGKLKYRSLKDSPDARVERKLTGKYNWFRNAKKKDSNEDEDENEDSKNDKYKKRGNNKGEEDIEKVDNKDMPKSVLFVQNTPDSILAKNLRKMLQELKPWTQIGIKVVERTGERLEDILHKSDPWDMKDCNRKDCKPFESAAKDKN